MGTMRPVTSRRPSGSTTGIGHLMPEEGALRPAIEDIGLSLVQAVFQPRLVEKGHIQGAGVVHRPELHQIQPLADVGDGGRGRYQWRPRRRSRRAPGPQCAAGQSGRRRPGGSKRSGPAGWRCPACPGPWPAAPPMPLMYRTSVFRSAMESPSPALQIIGLHYIMAPEKKQGDGRMVTWKKWAARGV